LDSAETNTTIEMIRKLIDEKIIAPTNGGGANYENGNGAMLFHSSSAITKYKNYIKEDYDIVTFPVINGESGVTGYGVPGYGIYSGIDESKRDLAWQLLSFLMSIDGQNTLAEAGMHTPSIRNDLQDYNTAAWGEGYRDLNLAATTYETSRNYSETFFLNFAATTKTDLLGACSDFVSNIMTYGSDGKPSFTSAKCIETAIKTLKKASYVK
jgi:ABC-type glycerol-3-phosphate transport system substrate-binding protein